MCSRSGAHSARVNAAWAVMRAIAAGLHNSTWREDATPAPPPAQCGWFKNLVGHETDALRDFFVAQRKQRGLGHTQALEFVPAFRAPPHVDFHVAAPVLRKFPQKVVAQI